MKRPQRERFGALTLPVKLLKRAVGRLVRPHRGGSTAAGGRGTTGAEGPGASARPEPDDAGAATLDVDAFLDTDFAGRIAAAQKLSTRRLHGAELAAIWMRVTDAVTEDPGRGGPIVHRLRREVMTLNPAGAEAQAALAAYLDERARPVEPGPSFVTLVISCERYLAKARNLHASLSRTLDPTFIVVGDPTLSEATFDGPLLRVPAADTYEALPQKVLEAFVAIRRAFGSVGVLKIDDDAKPAEPPSRATLEHALSSLDYAGSPAGHRSYDRTWHLGKAETVRLPRSRRFRGKWAKGAVYYVGPRALDILVREHLLYPAELDGELYEDKLVGDVLRENGITVEPVDLAAMLDVTITHDLKGGVPPFRLERRGMRNARATRGSSKVVLAFIGTVDRAAQWNTLGDVMAVYNVGKALERRGVDFHIAWDGFLFDLSDRRVDLESIDPSEYGCFAYVCGPAHRGLSHLYERFARVPHRVAVGVSVIDRPDQDPKRWFDAVYARDSRDFVSFDLALADIGWPCVATDARQRQPGASVCCVGPQGLYGKQHSLHLEAEAMIQTGLDLAGVARRVPVQTLIRPDAPNPYVAELELQASRFVVTTRMHGSLLSLLYGVPVIAVDQIRGGAKVSRVVTATGWPVLRADRDGAAAVAEMVRRVEAGDLDELVFSARARMIELSRAALRESVELIVSGL